MHNKYLQKMINAIPRITKNLLIINILMFFATVVAERYGVVLENYLALHYFGADNFMPHQLLTYMFMHGGFSHLFFNMFALFMFGSVVERTWGERKFLFYYLVCGVGAGLVQEVSQYVEFSAVLSNYKLVDIGEGIRVTVVEFLNLRKTVGASGAVYGILLAFGVLYPNERLFIFPIPVPIRAKFLIIGYIVLELYLAIANRPNDVVAHFAHLGGMLFGFILIMYWRNKRNRNVRGFR